MKLYHKLKRYIGKAIFGYEMLKPEDTIIVALSGGEDSLVLLYFLSQWRNKIKASYRLIGVHLDMNFPKDEGAYQRGISWLENFCSDLKIEFFFEKTDCGKQALEAYEKKNTSPCFVCSWHRRKHLFKLSDKLKANKIAFGHHLDDVITTFFINMFYNGELSTILPVQEMFKGKLFIIRPLILVEKELISRFVKSMGWQVLENPCPFTKATTRNFIENFLREKVYTLGPKIKKNIACAMFNPKWDYLPRKIW